MWWAGSPVWLNAGSPLVACTSVRVDSLPLLVCTSVRVDGMHEACTSICVDGLPLTVCTRARVDGSSLLVCTASM